MTNIDEILANSGSVGGRSMSSIFMPSKNSGGSMLPALASAGGQAIPGILGSFLTYIGMEEQNKLTRETNKQAREMFDLNRADDRYKFDTTTAENSRQFDKTFALNQTTAQNNLKLANRGYDIQEKKIDASIADSQANRELAKADRIMAGKMLQINNITKFFNTPQSRSAFASLWQAA